MPLLLSLSQSILWIGLALTAQLISFRLLRLTGKQFQAVTKNQHEAFDFQNKLTPQDIYAQLADYTPDSKRIYQHFFVIDFFFPLFASLFLSLLWTAIFQRFEMPAFETALRWSVPLLAFLPAVFDWGENTCFLILIQRYPAWSEGLAKVSVALKRLKLASLALTIGATMLLIVVVVILGIGSLFRQG